MIHDLLSQVSVNKIDNGHTAAQTLVTSSTLDTAGYDGALIIADLAAFVDAGVATLQAQDGAASDGSDAANIAGASVAKTGSTSGNGQLVLDVVLPQKRYLTVTLTRATQNITVNSITVILYRAKNIPVTQPSTVLKSAIVEAAS